MSYAMVTLHHATRAGAGMCVRCLVDTGAICTVLPRHVWQKLRLEPLGLMVNPLSRRVLPMRTTLSGLH